MYMYIINYKNLEEDEYYTGIAISKVNQKIEFHADNMRNYVKLIPDRKFEGKIESEYKIREYIKYYYVNVLSKLDPDEVYRELKWDKLATFDNGEFSHGYIVAAWFELFLGVKVKCVNKNEILAGKLKDVKPKWTMDLLEDEIKKTIDNMKGFNSVRALYLFNQSEELERMADKLEDRVLNDKSLSKEQIYKFSDSAHSYRQAACFRRCDADMAEDAWRERRHVLIENAKKREKRI